MWSTRLLNQHLFCRAVFISWDARQLFIVLSKEHLKRANFDASHLYRFNGDINVFSVWMFWLFWTVLFINWGHSVPRVFEVKTPKGQKTWAGKTAYLESIHCIFLSSQSFVWVQASPEPSFCLLGTASTSQLPTLRGVIAPLMYLHTLAGADPLTPV